MSAYDIPTRNRPNYRQQEEIARQKRQIKQLEREVASLLHEKENVLSLNIHVQAPEDQTVANSPERKPTEDRCALCLSPLRRRTDGRLVVETPCEHSFHLDCLRNCKEHGNDDCPLCRSTLPSGQGLTPMKSRSLKEEEDSPLHRAHSSHIRPSEPSRSRGTHRGYEYVRSRESRNLARSPPSREPSRRTRQTRQREVRSVQNSEVCVIS